MIKGCADHKILWEQSHQLLQCVVVQTTLLKQSRNLVPLSISPFGNGPECMSEEKNSTLQWFDNFKFYNVFLKSDRHASLKLGKINAWPVPT